MIVAVTGPVKPRAGMSIARFAVARELGELPWDEITEFRTGAAYGIDSAAYWCALAVAPEHVKHTVMVPQGKWYNQDLVLYAKQEGHNIVGVPGGYLKRDDALVEGADLLLAFPQSGDEVLRSGTWATIRRARKRNMTIRMKPLDELREAVLELGL